MKTHVTPLLALAGLLFLSVSCKREADSMEASSDLAAADTTGIAPELPPHQFIRTADIRFRVKDVANATEKIESTVRRFGGFVTHTHLRSDVAEKKTASISLDSVVETTRYTVENTLTLRVPNTALDTVLTAIGRQAVFLDSREIDAQDASLDLIAQRLTQRRNENAGKRIEKAIDQKPAKLKDAVAAESDNSARQQTADEAYISELSLRDRVAFSTVTLAIYQKESLKTEVLPNFENTASLRPPFGIRLLESLRSGWFLLEGFVFFVLTAWPVWVLVALIALLTRKRLVRKLN
ncbi:MULTISPECIES: DUF4349 domain-containing protein [unclassified Flavobacterium]|uniref:DUF4349 domain-containing protein n=1 Tax=unclassified Flavobacterium TaxID=196869 RepID=UPI001F14950B|nr:MULTISPECIES: DUF4349 domain-containing protein [unclassified Flavobacterium]UMY64777.1 DUF4349 domain-containing protein [Flavobacterium sp. HJ-32-4]